MIIIGNDEQEIHKLKERGRYSYFSKSIYAIAKEGSFGCYGANLKDTMNYEQLYEPEILFGGFSYIGWAGYPSSRQDNLLQFIHLD